MMTSSPRKTWKHQATRTEMRTGKKILCSRSVVSTKGKERKKWNMQRPCTNDLMKAFLFFFFPLCVMPTFFPSHSWTPPSNPAPHLVHARPLDLVITGVRCRLVDDVCGRPTELHPLPLEAEIRDPRDVLLAVPKVVREEERQPADGVEARPALQFCEHLSHYAKQKPGRKQKRMDDDGIQ